MGNPKRTWLESLGIYWLRACLSEARAWCSIIGPWANTSWLAGHGAAPWSNPHWHPGLTMWHLTQTLPLSVGPSSHALLWVYFNLTHSYSTYSHLLLSQILHCPYYAQVVNLQCSNSHGLVNTYNVLSEMAPMGPLEHHQHNDGNNGGNNGSRKQVHCSVMHGMHYVLPLASDSYRHNGW